MSVVTHATEAGQVAPDRVRRWISLALAIVALVGSVVELVTLVSKHTLGAEVYGVLVAVLALLAGVFTLSLLVPVRRRVAASVGVLVLWTIVAFGGIAGAYYHAVGVDPKYSPVDPRPRPAAAPLIFTALAVAGGVGLFYGQRLGLRISSSRSDTPSKEV
jgi:hypothetical protein